MRNCRGFTLLEVMMAASLTAIILAALYGSFFVTQRSVTATQSTLIALHEARVALDIMRREIEASFTQDDKEEFMVKDRDFYGKQASSMSFTTVSSLILGPARISYRIEESDGHMSLVKTLTGIVGTAKDAPEAIMVEEVSSFTVEASSNGKTWQRSWMENKPPKALRITLEVPLGEKSISLTIKAMPRVGRKV